MFKFERVKNWDVLTVKVQPPEDFCGEIVVPEIKDGLPVTKVVLCGLADPKRITKLRLPRYAQFLSFEKTDRPICVEVDPENENIICNGDALYSKDMSRLELFLAWSRESFEIPNGVKVIANSAFRYAGRLREVTLPESLAEIREEAFISCESLEKINLEKVREIEVFAFGRCKMLDNIWLTCERIPPHCFIFCRSLSSVTLENTVSIGNNAFFGTSVKRLALPESIEEVTGELPAEVIEIPFSENSRVLSRLTAHLERLGIVEGAQLVIRSPESGEVLCRVMAHSAPLIMYCNKYKPLGFDFERFDENFSLSGYKFGQYRAAFFRVEHPYGLSEENRARYERFLCDYAEKYVLELISKEDIQKLAEFGFYGSISGSGFMEIIKAAAAKKNPEMTALLLQKKSELKECEDDL